MLSRTIRRIVPPTILFLLVVALAGPGGWTGPSHARAQAPAKPDARAADRAAVRAAMKLFVDAFEAADARRLADHWTDQGEYLREGQGAIRGRDALRAAFTEMFARSPKLRAEVETESVRFLAQDNAIEEGFVTMRASASEPTITARYSALFVREGGRWRIALLREWPGEESASLRDLAWLVGEWKSKGAQAAEIITSYSWDENKKFLKVRFTIKEKDRNALSGFQVLGKDPASGEIHAWTFEAEGGIGEAVWRRDGEHWTADSAGTLVDGRKLTATNVLWRINDDTFTWQSVNRMLDGVALADLPPVKVTRVTPAK
jgi:uncharacterized protein (TIGR02246 family)